MGNPNQAGLPQTQQTSGGLPLGALMALPSAGMLQTLSDGSKWLRTGVIVAKSVAPTAALVETLRAHQFSESASSALPSVAASFLVTNGSGTYVVGYGSGDATNVYVSTDYGVTWTARAHNMAGATGPFGMCWTGSYFVGVNTAGTTFYACTSPDGVTWTASATGVTSGGTYTANTAKVVWTGTTVFACTAATGANQCMTSPTGLTGTWTTRVLAVSISSAPQLDASSYGIIMQFGTSVQTGTADGITWTSRSPGTIVSAAKPMAFSDRFVLFQAVGGVTTQSVDSGLTWSNPVNSGVDAPTYAQMGKTAAGRVYGVSATNPQISYTDDGVYWKTQGFAITNPASQYPSVANSFIATDGARSMVLVTAGATGQKVQYAASSFNASNAIGTAVSYSTGSSGTNLFAKVK